MMKETDSSEEQALTCPLLALRPETLDDSIRRLTKSTGPDACLRGRCGWWDGEVGQCAVLTMATLAKSLSLK